MTKSGVAVAAMTCDASRTAGVPASCLTQPRGAPGGVRLAQGTCVRLEV